MIPRLTQPAPSVDQAVSVAQGGTASLTDIERRLAPDCERAAPRRHAMAYLRGLCRPAERTNSWQLADASGHAIP